MLLKIVFYLIITILLIAFFLKSIIKAIKYRKYFYKLVFPDIFIISFHNCETQVKALMKMLKVSKHTKIVRVDFTNVQKLDEATYMLFLAQVEKLNKMGKEVFLYGILKTGPKNIIIKKKKYLHKNIDLEDEKIDVRVYSSVEAGVIDGVVYDFLKTIKASDYYSPLYDFLIELVGNATEHGIKSHKINWWLHYEENKKNNSVTYTFVDMGSGIIESYRNSNFLNRFRRSKKIIKDALAGKLGSTTKKKGRGRGLPQISSMVKDDLIYDFVLITNKVSLYYKNNIWHIKKIPNFKGTYYSWTVSEENYKIWQKKLR